MLQALKNAVYSLIVWSGITNYLMSIIKSLVFRFMFREGRKSNYVLKDASGATIKVTRYNGRLYIPFTEHKLQTIPDMKIRKTDLLLCGYPKTGCHWMYEIMFMLLNRKATLSKHGKELGGMIDTIPGIILDSLPSPRVLNTHLLYEELPKGVKESKTKIVYTVRNPKDTLVSYYNHHFNFKVVYGYSGNIDDYFKLFMEGNLDGGSYFDHILAWDNVIKNQTDNPILLVSFEEIKAKPIETIHRLAAFLGIDITENFASEVASASSFKKVKAERQKAGVLDGLMFRKGIVGDWRNWLTDDQSKTIDKVWNEKMKDCLYQPNY